MLSSHSEQVDCSKNFGYLCREAKGQVPASVTAFCIPRVDSEIEHRPLVVPIVIVPLPLDPTRIY